MLGDFVITLNLLPQTKNTSKLYGKCLTLAIT